MFRDIKRMITDIIDTIPKDYENRSEVVSKLDKIYSDSFYKAPELMYEYWTKIHQILVDEFWDDTLSIGEWNWRDEIFEFFSDYNYDEDAKRELMKERGANNG